MENIYSFTAAVRGFRYHRTFCNPKENEKLDCSHEEHKPFNWFAIKTVTRHGMIVGHLPIEISRITKIFLDRGAVIKVELKGGKLKHCRRSPLVKGGMEIACLVRARIPATLKKYQARRKMLTTCQRERYTEPKNEEILGCFVTNIGTDMEKEIPATVREKIKEK